MLILLPIISSHKLSLKALQSSLLPSLLPLSHPSFHSEIEGEGRRGMTEVRRRDIIDISLSDESLYLAIFPVGMEIKMN